MYRAKFYVRWFLLLLALTACKSENNTSNQNTQNDRPKLVLNTCKNSNIIENNQFTCQVLAEDLNPNTTLKYRLNTLPMGMTIDLNGKISWTPGDSVSSGQRVIEVEVDDRSGTGNATDIKKFTLNVTAINDGPKGDINVISDNKTGKVSQGDKVTTVVAEYINYTGSIQNDIDVADHYYNDRDYIRFDPGFYADGLSATKIETFNDDHFSYIINAQDDNYKYLNSYLLNNISLKPSEFSFTPKAEVYATETNEHQSARAYLNGIPLYLKIQAQIDQGHIYINGYEHDSINLPYKREIDNTESHYLIDPTVSSKYFSRLMFYDSVKATLLPFHGFLEHKLDISNEEKEKLKDVIPLPDSDVLFESGTFFADGYPAQFLCIKLHQDDQFCQGVPLYINTFGSEDKNNIFAFVHVSHIEKEYSALGCNKDENYVLYKGNDLLTAKLGSSSIYKYTAGRRVEDGEIIYPNDADINDNPCNRID